MLNIPELPKLDLHCHLDGSLSIPMMERHLGRAVAPEEVCVDSGCTSLTEYLTKFDIPVQCLQTALHLEEEAEAFLESLAPDHIRYVEVRFAPMLSLKKGLSCRAVIESVLRGLARGREKTGISFGVITCAMRNFTPDENLRLLDDMEKFLGAGVCALDLAGDESRYPNTLFHELFEEARRRKIPFTIHSGETGNVENVRTAIEYGASRIGHGLALIQDRDLMQEVARRGIGIEMCPTSNLQTRAASSLAEYPLDKFLEAGIRVSINTDNRTVSRTTMEQELTLIRDLYRDEEMLRQVLKNAEETAFLRQPSV